MLIIVDPNVESLEYGVHNLTVKFDEAWANSMITD